MNIVRCTPATFRRRRGLVGDVFGFNPIELFNFPVMPEMDWRPSTDVKEEDGRYVITAELPGLQEKDFEVKLERELLTIQGEKRREESEEKNNYRRVERAYGRFERRFHLPEDVDAGKISAVYRNGVLTVDIPKSPESKPKHRSIKVNAA